MGGPSITLYQRFSRAAPGNKDLAPGYLQYPEYNLDLASAAFMGSDEWAVETVSDVSEPEPQRGRANMTGRLPVPDQLMEDRRPAPHVSCTFGALAALRGPAYFMPFFATSFINSLNFGSF
jgi:hypothetical protein